MGSFEDGGEYASFEPGGGPTGASAVAVGEQRNQSTGARYLDYICGRVYFRGTRGRGTWQERAGACGGDGGHIQRRSLAASFEPGRTGVGGRSRRDPFLHATHFTSIFEKILQSLIMLISSHI